MGKIWKMRSETSTTPGAVAASSVRERTCQITIRGGTGTPKARAVAITSSAAAATSAPTSTCARSISPSIPWTSGGGGT